MAAWRSLGILAGLLITAGFAPAQSYPLAEEVKVGDCFKLKLSMNLAGEIKVSRDGKPAGIKESATANHEFIERVLNVDKLGVAEKCARRYSMAHAVIAFGAERSAHDLQAERGLIVAQRLRDQIFTYCPTTALTHEELEVLEHFDTLSLPAVLPGKTVKIGESWKLPNSAVQSLCHFEGLTEQHITGELASVKGNLAQITLKGTASGIEMGALVKLTIEATGQFDLDAKRLVRLDWKQKDEREQGPASPASSVEVTITVERATTSSPENLSDVAIVSVPSGTGEPPSHMTQVQCTDPKGRFDLTHNREWVMVGQTEEHTILRLMDRGDFVAQVTITPWEPAEKGKHLEPDKFREMMAKTPGWEMEKEVQFGEVPSEGGRWVYRISALGQLDGANVMQNFYLIAGPSGEQAVLVFTMTPKQAERLGSRDLALAGSLDFPKKK